MTFMDYVHPDYTPDARYKNGVRLKDGSDGYSDIPEDADKDFEPVDLEVGTEDTADAGDKTAKKG